MNWDSDTNLIVFGVLLVSAYIAVTLAYQIHARRKRMASYITDPYKIYCVVSLEAIKLMGGNRGKMIAQGGHAYVHAFTETEKKFPDKAAEYLETGKAYKITLAVETTAELYELEALYKDRFGTALITDAAHTVFKEPTTTCLGIGPIRESERETILKGLRPFK